MKANGITAMNLPITPETNKSGMNVITVVITPDTTDGSTSAVPSIAACTRPFPILRWRSTLSLTTIASSTSMPTAIRKANIESMLSVWSPANMSAPVPSIDTGTPIATQNPIFRSKKSASSTNTIANPCVPLESSMSSRSRTSTEASAQVTSS